MINICLRELLLNLCNRRYHKNACWTVRHEFLWNKTARLPLQQDYLLPFCARINCLLLNKQASLLSEQANKKTCPIVEQEGKSTC